MTVALVALAAVLLAYAVSESLYGAVHEQQIVAARSIPAGVRRAVVLRERVVGPGALLSAGGALVSLAVHQACGVALVALVCTSAALVLAHGVIAIALVGAGQATRPAIESIHDRADRRGREDDLLDRVSSARVAADRRLRRNPDPTPEA